MRPLIKSELMSLATSAYQAALNDFDLKDRSMMEDSCEHVVDCFINKEVNGQTCCGQLDDELLRGAVKSLVLAKVILQTKQERLKEVLWPIITSMVESGKVTEAEELVRSLPEGSTRMLAIGFIQKFKI